MREDQRVPATFNPGCYPTAAQLPLIPLLQADLIESTDLAIIDAKSGTTGAGRAAKRAFLYCEVTDGIQAYGVASRSPRSEIEQGLSRTTMGPEMCSGIYGQLHPAPYAYEPGDPRGYLREARQWKLPPISKPIEQSL